MNAANDLHVTNPVAKMEELVRAAEAGNADALLTTRVVLANALIKGRPVDEDRLRRLAIRVGKNARAVVGSPYIFRWGGLLTVISDYIEHKQVAMPDGRVATADGWNYENCEPSPIPVDLPGDLHDRCTRLASDRGDADLSKILREALTEYLDRWGV